MSAPAKVKTNARGNKKKANGSNPQRGFSQQQRRQLDQLLSKKGVNLSHKASQEKPVDLAKIAKILTTVAMPELCNNNQGISRYNPGVVGTPTAVASPPSNESYAGTATSTVAAFGADTVFILQRNAPAHQIHRVIPPTAATWYYKAALMSDDATTGDNPTYTPKFDIDINSEKFISPCRWDFSSGNWKKHGDMFLNAVTKADPSKRLIFIDAGEKVKLRLTPSMGTQTKFIAYRYESGKLTHEVDVSAGLAGGTPDSLILTISEAGYYCFSLLSDAAGHYDFVEFTVHHDNADSSNFPLVHRHLCVETYCANIWSWPELAILGSTMRFQNDASFLNLQGKIVCADLPPGKFWQNFSSYSDVAGLAGRVTFDARDGAQMKLGLKNPDVDLGLTTYATLNVNDEIVDSRWDLEQECPSTILGVAISDATGRACTLEVVDTVEFRTTDKSRELAPPEASKMEWIAALQEFHRFPRFTKNGIHIEEFRNAMKNVLGGVVRYAPKVISAVTVGAQAARIASSMF